MNFLAHFYLSGDDEQLLIGNFIADGVKGQKYLDYPAGIRQGILMHRAIDHFTDTHEINSAAKDLLRVDYNHFSGIMLDVFYDHFLAVDWERHHAIPLQQFASEAYELLGRHVDAFPERPKYMLPFMKQHDWLNAYATIEGVDRVMHGMSRRVTNGEVMRSSAVALEKNYDQLQQRFREFFPLIIEHTEEFRKR